MFTKLHDRHIPSVDVTLPLWIAVCVLRILYYWNDMSFVLLAGGVNIVIYFVVLLSLLHKLSHCFRTVDW